MLSLLKRVNSQVARPGMLQAYVQTLMVTILYRAFMSTQ